MLYLADSLQEPQEVSGGSLESDPPPLQSVKRGCGGSALQRNTLVFRPVFHIHSGANSTVNIDMKGAAAPSLQISGRGADTTSVSVPLTPSLKRVDVVPGVRGDISTPPSAAKRKRSGTIAEYLNPGSVVKRRQHPKDYGSEPCKECGKSVSLFPAAQREHKKVCRIRADRDSQRRALPRIKGSSRRKQYTYAYKKAVLEELFSLEQKRLSLIVAGKSPQQLNLLGMYPQAIIADLHDVGKSMISKWRRDSAVIFDQCKIARRKRLVKAGTNRYKFANVDAAVMSEFRALRADRKRVGPRWLRRKYKAVLTEKHPESAKAWRGGQQWRTSFYARNHISLRKRTNNHKLKWPDRRAKLESFVAGTQALVLKSLNKNDLTEEGRKQFQDDIAKDGPDRPAIKFIPRMRRLFGSMWYTSEHVPFSHGKYPMCLRSSVDQVPFSFDGGNDTLAETGAEQVKYLSVAVHSLWSSSINPVPHCVQVCVHTGRDSDHKRMGTLQVMICCLPKDLAKYQPPLAIIFRGQGGKYYKQERAQYDKRVDVYFQKKAWADRKFCRAWVASTAKPALERIKSITQSAKINLSKKTDVGLAFHDNLDGQKNSAYTKFWPKFGGKVCVNINNNNNI